MSRIYLAELKKLYMSKSIMSLRRRMVVVPVMSHVLLVTPEEGLNQGFLASALRAVLHEYERDSPLEPLPGWKEAIVGSFTRSEGRARFNLPRRDIGFQYDGRAASWDLPSGLLK